MPEAAYRLRQTGQDDEADAYATDAGQEFTPASERSHAALSTALKAVSSGQLQPSMAAVAAAIPVAASVELALVRVADDAGALHLMAAEGVPHDRVRRRALTPIALEQARAFVADDGSVPAGNELGISWGEFIWIGKPSDPRGTLTVACRTQRRPSERERRLVRFVAAALASGLEHHDRRPQTLTRLSRSLALPGRGDPGSHVALERLSPRESTILKLYAEEMSTAEVADLLVLSPDTVRTHVRNALRHLGLHTRAEAVALVIAAMSSQLF